MVNYILAANMSSLKKLICNGIGEELLQIHQNIQDNPDFSTFELVPAPYDFSYDAIRKEFLDYDISHYYRFNHLINTDVVARNYN